MVVRRACIPNVAAAAQRTQNEEMREGYTLRLLYTPLPELCPLSNLLSW